MKGPSLAGVSDLSWTLAPPALRDAWGSRQWERQCTCVCERVRVRACVTVNQCARVHVHVTVTNVGMCVN